MTLSSISIKRPVFAWVLMFGLIFFGTLSFFQMGINENPDVDYPTVRISYAYEGATPAVVEKDIIETVESYLVSIQGIRNISSTAQRGVANIDIEFELSRDIDFALQEVQTVLGRAQRGLPDNLESPVVTKSNAADEPILYASLFSESLSQRDLMILFRDRVRDRLSTVEGVAEIRAFGYHEPILRIDLDAEKLRKYQLTAQDIIDSILREHSELPAGKFEFKEDEFLIRIMGEANQVDEFRNMIISRRGGQPNFARLHLKDVADVYEGIENLRRLSRINGKNAMGMAIQRQSGVNAVDLSDKVMARIAEINQELQPEAGMMVNFDRTQFVRESVDELVYTLILSAVLTSLVCWIFLGSWSATSNILFAIPTSIIGTFTIIHFLGFTLNTFSLLGLALAIGVVVDDAIIMLENISRYMQMGYDRVQAAFKGSREITFAVIATSLALIAIFIPITFMDGIEGRFFWEFAVTISVAVALSSLEALTLAPMRCSQFLRVGGKRMLLGRMFESFLDSLTALYEKTLKTALRFRWLVLVGSIAIVSGAFLSVRSLPTEFAPAQDRSVIFTIFLAPDGRSMEYTSEKVAQFEKIALAHPDVDRTFVAIGGFGQGGQGNRGNGVIILKPSKDRKKSISEVSDELRKSAEQEIKGMNVILRDRFGSALGGRRGSPIEFTINGPNPATQKELYFKMQDEMEASGLMVGIRSNDVRELPEVRIVPNREKALERGVEISEISRIVNATLGGTTVAQYTEGSRRFDIFLQLKESDRQGIEDLKPLLVRNNRGELIPLSSVVDVKNVNGPESIFREDRVRGIRVDSSLAKGATQGNAIKEVRAIAEKILPEDYYIRFSDTPDDKLFSIAIIMGLGLIIAYMVLASQFNSFTDPFIVYLAVPFGLIGSIAALFLGGQTLNIYSVIGMLLTMGIVMKNSILLVEFTNQLRDEGADLEEALVKACPIRLRPILMTTTATLAAALPAAMAFGPGNETRIPMALTVIGGTSLSTVFTLFVVPCVFRLINPKRRKPFEEEPDRPVAA
ncbi:efflux RND transporter permease subunit [Pseudobacteriovorax antillogorgiicola]|uniref:Hydrophobic/amphiphilic exporter-1, HAE1 family n=1 Tax=Pseudobacteriovorax antillogorgiicola TaxID=1513793 RepID=A0A1Y6BRU5_9BACT|nr:efflux RND transporter permease subunit [Pseudobacteriovorax antillogorgiicola]TCS54672.1 HAE1 family hydrophobic/amphiphilic exporter-1 [Pseudobacteriovorax antillogorgiicola]SMF16688.1 hydrophobic/amphiphilic exporter-1, HAE1 family [Pseudobacteriovorax antillogorgiicola]